MFGESGEEGFELYPWKYLCTRPNRRIILPAVFACDLTKLLSTQIHLMVHGFCGRAGLGPWRAFCSWYSRHGYNIQFVQHM
mmetsp:Transcript_13375/g.21209  ORF Transcript_13375/g.21209 Transcript_13375/m.21209 type:complete len:81 (+) Transcript_13375:239-481(+)